MSTLNAFKNPKVPASGERSAVICPTAQDVHPAKDALNAQSKMKKTIATLTAALCVALSPVQAQVLITQYYEGTSFNKWIELTNVGSSDVDLSLYALGLWTNANAEGYKTDTAPSQTLTLSGTLTPGTSFLLANSSSSTVPSYAVANVLSSTVINFNGNDSIALYLAGTFSTSSIVDAVGFTNAGNEGIDKSFYRLNADVGWDTTTGSTVLSFPSVWQLASLAEVADAAELTDPRLGYSSVTAVPEPGTVALIGFGLGVVLLSARRRQS